MNGDQRRHADRRWHGIKTLAARSPTPARSTSRASAPSTSPHPQRHDRQPGRGYRRFQADATLSDDYYGYSGNYGAYGYYLTATAVFTNAGTLEDTAGSGTTTIDYTLNNNAGTVNNSGAGSLVLAGAVNDTATTSLLSDTGTGSFTLDGGGTLGSTVTVSGMVTLSGGTFTTAAAGTVIAVPSGGTGAMAVTGGTLALGGSLDSTILSPAGPSPARAPSLPTARSPSTAASAGPSPTTAITWSGGTMNGAITNAGTLTVAGAAIKTLGGTLTNDGTVTVAGIGTIYLASSSAPRSTTRPGLPSPSRPTPH